MVRKLQSRSALAVAIVLLIWAITGCVAYIAQVTADLGEMAKYDAYQARIFAGMPGWAWSAYAVAVWSGLAGVLLMLFGSRLCLWMFILSLAGIVTQFSYSFLMTDLLIVRGANAAILPAVITAIALFQIGYALRLIRRGELRA